MTAAGDALTVRDLRKRYGTLQAVDGISFSVRRGEVFGMLGPNGAGKTTTIEIIEGLRRADSGAVQMLGRDLARDPAAIKERIGVQLQTPTLLPRLSVTELLSLFGSFYARAVPPAELIRMVGLEASRNQLAGTLSGGQAQRLSLALALVNQPELLFLDEPTTGLDPQARANLWELIESVRASGATVLLTTHYMEEAERLCDRVAIVDHGQIVALDSPRQLIAAHFNETAIRIGLDGALHESLSGLPAVTHVEAHTEAVTLFTTDVAATIAALLELARTRERTLTDLLVRSATLEDVFLTLTGRRLRE